MSIFIIKSCQFSSFGVKARKSTHQSNPVPLRIFLIRLILLSGLFRSLGGDAAQFIFPSRCRGLGDPPPGAPLLTTATRKFRRRNREHPPENPGKIGVRTPSGHGGDMYHRFDILRQHLTGVAQPHQCDVAAHGGSVMFPEQPGQMVTADPGIARDLRRGKPRPTEINVDIPVGHIRGVTDTFVYSISEGTLEKLKNLSKQREAVFRQPPGRQTHPAPALEHLQVGNQKFALLENRVRTQNRLVQVGTAQPAPSHPHHHARPEPGGRKPPVNTPGRNQNQSGKCTLTGAPGQYDFPEFMRMNAITGQIIRQLKIQRPMAVKATLQFLKKPLLCRCHHVDSAIPEPAT